MPSHTKVKLSDIHALTFYAGEKTLARRTSPIAQLKCIGKPCRTFQPDVVRCTNTGGTGVDVDWKCETDLPASLRLGRVEVSCEGWARPGDPNVLKGSCGLEYHLLEVPKAYRDDHTSTSDPSKTDYFNKALDWGFFLLFAAVAAFLAFKILEGCLVRPQTPRAGGTRPGGGGGTGGGGWFGGQDRNDAPPPYTKSINTDPNTAGGWRPGFWTGLGLGGLAGRYFRPSPTVPYGGYADPYMRRESYWDWDRSWFTRTRPGPAPPPRTSERASPRSSSWFGGGGENTARGSAWTDRGEGSSSGTMRSSTGYGGSRVR
ncbi:DUF1183-domain-containing protein [Auricularia subglabra TFB-10046 SS5]|nr:DUF1183-domain-containing protein [Auricularia subglabra TFB-10046 SS5]